MHSMVIGDVDYLPETGNILIASGIAFADSNYSTIAEVTYPGKQVVFEAKLYYRDYFVPEGVEGWTGADIAYRAERVAVPMAQPSSDPVSGSRQPGSEHKRVECK